jgi:tetratricopeptide (TPR) repeat protein
MKQVQLASRPRHSAHSHHIALILFVTLQICLILAGCLRDPNVRKQKFMEEGDRYFAKEKYPEALLTYERAVQIDPRLVAGHYGIAKCHLKMGNWLSAFQELQRTIDLEPQNWPAHLDRGQLYLAGGRALEARDEAKSILEANGSDIHALILYSDAEAQLGDLKVALQKAGEAVRIAPEDATAYLNIAGVQQRAGLLQDAETSLVKARSLSPNSAVPNLALGSLYAGQKRWADAEGAFRSAIAMTPKDATPRAALANLYVAEGHADLAEKVLTEAKAQLANDPAAYPMLGAFYLTRGDNARALTEFASLAKDHPADLRVCKSYAQLLILDHRIDEAAKLTEDILKKSPQDADALILKGEILLQKEKPDEALQVLQQVVKDAPANPIGHYQIGMAHLAKGSVNQAENEWREAVRLSPNLKEAWIALGGSATQRRDWTVLEAIADQLKKIGPTTDAFLFHATARINQGDAAGAETDLNQLIRLLPQSPLGYNKLGQLRTSQKRWDEAQNFYREALKRSPDFLEATQGLVDLDFRRGRAAEGLQFLRTQIEAHPNNTSLYLLQGESYLRNKQLPEAEHSLSLCVQLDQQNAAGFALLARVQQDMGKTSDAIVNYQHAITIAPKNAGLYASLGASFEAQGNWQSAQTAYERALAIQPGEPLASNNLAYLLLEHQGNVNVALTLALAARRGLPDLPNSADTLGWAYFQNGAYSMAAQQFEQAIKIAPANPTYRYHLGVTYQKLNDPKRARKELEKSISLDPKAPSAEKASHILGELSGTA